MDWKEKFIAKYITGSPQSLEEALDLKRQNIPEKLFRYRSLNSFSRVLNEITTGQIYLSHPKDFNDPFDSSSILEHDKPWKYFVDREKYRESLRPHMDATTEVWIFESEDWFIRMSEFVAENSLPNGSQVEKSVLARDLVSTIMAEVETLNHSFTEMTRSMSRIACFTTKPDNLPMWSHYASNHTGVCLEYDIERIPSMFMMNRLFPVYYCDKLPDIVKHLAEKKELGKVLGYVLLHKLRDWSYEDEWRLIYDAGVFYPNPEKVPKQYWGQGRLIEFTKPTKVILGISVSADDEKVLREICDSHRIEVTKMKYTEYGMKESSEQKI